MAEIEEILIRAEDTPENTQEMQPPIPGNTTDIRPAPKKRGRPAGAKNKAKPACASGARGAEPHAPKPKPKAKQKKTPEYEEYEDSEEDEAPPPRRRVRAEPQVLDRHALASDVLSILQQQRYQRTSARRNHYASWLEKMS